MERSASTRVFSDWRRQEITQAVYEALKQLKANALEYLEENAGKDSLQDRYLVGMIAGFNSVLNMSAEDILERNEEDDN